MNSQSLSAPRLRSATLTACVLGFAATACSAQGSHFAGSGAASPKAGNNTTTMTSAAIPPVRPFSSEVRDGILTIDGMVAKVGMNYDINRAFMYFTVPGVGTAVVAQTRFMNSVEQKGAFHGNMLTINVNGHTVELTSAGPIAGDRKAGAEAWVAFDPLFGANEYPHMGFGDQQQRPYAWPGSKPSATARPANASIVPPPLPRNLVPKPEISSTYSVSVPASDSKK